MFSFNLFLSVLFVINLVTTLNIDRSTITSVVNTVSCKNSYSKQCTSSNDETQNNLGAFRIGNEIIKPKEYFERDLVEINEVEDKERVVKFTEATKSKVLLLVDAPGTGKTYSLLNYGSNQQKLGLKHLTLLINLGSTAEKLENLDVGNNLKNLSNLSKIFKNLSNFRTAEMKDFTNKYVTDNITILWDGFDEISPNNSIKVLDIIKMIQHSSNNRQIITSRETFGKILRDKLGVKIHKFVPLNVTSRELFIKKLIDFFKKPGSNKKSLINEIHKFLDKLENGDPKLFNLQMLSKLCNYTVHIPFPSTLEVRSFFEYFVSDLRNFTLQKGHIVREEIKGFERENKFNEIHQNFSIQKFYKHSELENYPDLKKIFVRSSGNIENKKSISRYGILMPNHEGQLEFQGQILTNYFLGQFINENNHSIAENFGNLVGIITNNSEFSNTVEFLKISANNLLGSNLKEIDNLERISNCFNFNQQDIDNYIKLSDASMARFQQFGKYVQLFNDSSLKPDEIQDCREFINELTQNPNDMEKFENLLNFQAPDLQKIEFTTKLFSNDQKILRKLWKVDRNRTFFFEYFLSTSRIVNNSPNNDMDTEKIIKMINIIENHFTSEDRNKIYRGKSQGLNSAFIIWLKQNNSGFVDKFGSKAMVPNVVEVLNQMMKYRNFSEFLKFVEMSSFSNEEKNEFCSANLKNFRENLNTEEYSAFLVFVVKHCL